MSSEGFYKTEISQTKFCLKILVKPQRAQKCAIFCVCKVILSFWTFSYKNNRFRRFKDKNNLNPALEATLPEFTGRNKALYAKIVLNAVFLRNFRKFVYYLLISAVLSGQ